jgi:hypothetical protein
MEKRFTLRLRSAESEIVKWEDVFDETKEMPGHQNKYQYVLDRTFCRPRDVIKFCNEILDQYKAGGSAARPKLTNEDVHQARQRYGDYFLRELDDEMHKHLPNYKNYLDLFKAIGSLEFDRKTLEKTYEERKATLNLSKDPLQILKELFDFSIVGFYRAGGRGGGSEYIFRYQSPQSRFDENAEKFKIHPGLLDILELKRWKKQGGGEIEEG